MGTQAVELATEAVETAEQVKLPALPYFIGTLGVAQLSAGRPGDAVVKLEQALALGKDDRYLQPINAFFLGEALHALGQIEEAKQAWQRAIHETCRPNWKHARCCSTRKPRSSASWQGSNCRRRRYAPSSW